MSNKMSEAELAVAAEAVPPRRKKSNYPPVFAKHFEGRVKRQLGDFFQLQNFGVNLTILPPGSASALLHRHQVQDEFIYILEGRPTLVTDRGEQQLEPGMCAGFAAADMAHQLVNRSQEPVKYLEIGDRLPGDSATYPKDDLRAEQDEEGRWLFLHKDGAPY